MLMMTILMVIPILAVLYISHHILQYWRFLKKVKTLPTTRHHPIFGHALDLMIPHNQLEELMTEMIEQQPDMFVLWLGPIPVLTVTHPRILEVILGNIKHINKTFPYSFLEPWLGTGLVTSTGLKWHLHRKMITPTFHFKILENFVEVFAEKSKILVKKLEKQLVCDDFDIYPYINKCAMDIICETAMGVQTNAQDQEEQSEYMNAVCKITDEIMERALHPWLYIDFIYRLTPSGWRRKKNIKILHDFTNKVIKERKILYKQKKSVTNDDDSIPGEKKKLAFLDLLLEASENGSKLTDEEIREEVDTFMFEGHDTTTVAICWALQMLGSNPDVQERVYEELTTIFKEDKDSSPTMKDLNEMKYLERVIKETLRKYPSVPIIAREVSEDIYIDGYTIPAGMKIILILGFTHRIAEFYPEPLKFNPDNFLPERVINRHPYAYVPFSAGPRNCIGQKFALLEEKMVLSYIIRHYKIEAVGEEPIAIPELILRPEKGIHLKITRRL